MEQPLPDPVVTGIFTGGGFITGILAAIGWLDKNYARKENVKDRLDRLDSEVAEIKKEAARLNVKLDGYHATNTENLTTLKVGQARMETTLDAIANSVDGQFSKLMRLIPKNV